jgi:hypothetical protein
MVQVRHFLAQASAEIDGCFTNRFLAGLDPEVQMVARSLALEAPEQVAAKIRREGAVFSSADGSWRGHAPRTWSPLRSRTMKPSNSRTSAMVMLARSFRKSMPGMTHYPGEPEKRNP